VACEAVERAMAVLADGELAGLLTVSRDDDGELAFEYRTDAGPMAQSPLLVRQAATATAISDRLEREGLSPAERAAVFAPPDFELRATNGPGTAPGTGPDEAAEYFPNYFLATALVVLVFMAILIYGNWVAGSVVEEKSSRAMELLITAATPQQLLVGKVVGTGAVGLTQYAAILAAAGLGLVLHAPLEELLIVGPAVPALELALSLPLLLVYGAFFMGGFLLYATLYAAVGSMVSRQEDINQVAGPMIVVVMIGYFASFFALNSIEAEWVTVLSFVPFVSPFLMAARLVLTTVPAWEVALALAILAATVVLALLLAARIYSAGVLLYGQKRSLREVLRAARVSR
jgi:ABC-2 type transport system permease protein